MKHHANIRKCKMQGRMYFGMDTGSGHWPSIRSTEYGAAFMHVRDWLKDRKFAMGDKKQMQFLREIIREQIDIMRKLDPKYFLVFCASKIDLFGGGYLQPDGSWGEKKTGACFETELRWSGFWPDNLPADAAWKVR